MNALSAIAIPAARDRAETGSGLHTDLGINPADTMFELPALERVKVVISSEVVSGNARPLYIMRITKEKTRPGVSA